MGQNMQIGTSAVRRWQLAAALKALREDVGLTQERAVERLVPLPGRWSRSKLSRVENREHNIKPREVEQLLDAYGVSNTSTREALVQLAAESKEQGWWAGFGNELPDAIKPLLSVEAGLVSVRAFENQFVHGLLQTPDYARAVMNAVSPAQHSPEELERRAAARMIRQHVLRREIPLNLHFVMDQTVLERAIGEPQVMRGQLRKLLDAAQSPNITLQVLPLDVGGSPGLEGPFSILTLPEPIPDFGYSEGQAGMFYIEDREHVRRCTLRFGILTELALSRADSVNLIAERMKSFD